MPKVLAKKMRGMNRWAKVGLIGLLTLITSIFVLKPLITNSALNQMYYFALDTTAVNVGYDGSTNTAFSTTGTGKYSLNKTVYTGSTSYASATPANVKTTVATLYSPAYAAPQTLANPKINVAVRGRTTGNVTWYADVYEYDPSTTGHQADRLLWSTTGTDTYSGTTTTNRVLTWSSTASQTISAGHRLKIIISAKSASITSRLYFYSSGTLYSYFKVDETAVGVNVANGSAIANYNVYAPSTGNAVDSFTMTSTNGTMTVTGITVTGNATTTSGNVQTVKIYRDNGTTVGALDAGDTLIGSGTLSGTSATIAVNESVGTTAQNYLVVYDVAGTPTFGNTLTGTVTGLTVTGGYLGTDTNTASATLTITPTTTVTNGSSEPPNTVLPSGGAATNVDAFGIKTNSGTDNLSTISVTLYPAGITTYITTVKIIDSSTGNVYNASQQGQTDTWRADTLSPQLTASTTEKLLYVQITPKNNVTGTLTVTALVTAVSNSQTANLLVTGDNTSATITLDGQPPTNPVLSASTGTSLAGGDINLSWTAATDASGLNAAKAYTVVRGAVNSPAPADCNSGTQVYQGGPGTLSFPDTGLQTGQQYSYRVCAQDVVGNTDTGTIAQAVSGVQTVCTNQPLVVLTPKTAVVAQGKSVTYNYKVINTDQGQCAPTPFTLSISGTENSTSFVTPSVISPTSLTIAANNGAANGTITVTSKTGVTQGDFDSFMLRVTATNHPTLDTQVRTIVNDYGPLLHSSLTLGTRYGNWGEQNTCATCHTKGLTPNIKRILSNISTPTGRKQVVFKRLSSTPGTLAGVFGNDTRPYDGSTNVCEVCHHQTRFHQYSASKLARTDHHPAADCMQCHPHKTGFKFSGTPQCTDCHGDPPKTVGELAGPDPTLALGVNPTNPGRHAKHDSMGFLCTVCHSNANHYPNYGAGPNGHLLMGFNINGTTYPGFGGNVVGGAFTGTNSLASYVSWSTATGTTLTKLPNLTQCSVYCHGWSGSNGNNTNPNWTGSNETLCGACHGASASAPPFSGSHPKHAGAGNLVLPNLSTVRGMGKACSTCHGVLANYTSGRHINGNVAWDLSQVSAIAAYRGRNSGTTGAPAPTTGGYGSCANIYCHSNVQGATNAALGTGGPYQYATPQWGTKVTCGDCHVNMYNSPNATGGHKQHAQDPNTSFDCRLCHSTGGDANPANHANGSIDLVFDPNGLANGTVYSLGTAITPGSGYGQCSNSNCHGRSARTWGPSTSLTLCEKCHGAGSHAFYSTLGPGSTTDMNDPTVGPVIGKHNAHINYSSSHHYTKVVDCTGCHLKPAGPYSPGHIDRPLPATVSFVNSTTYTKSRLNGYTTVSPSYVYSPSKNCSNVYCHGGGLASNLGRGNYSNVVADGGALGSPVTPTWNANMFTNGWTDPNKNPDNCQKCHSSPPPAPNASYTHYGKKPNECCGCHPGVNTAGDGFDDPSYHIDGQVKGGCTLCHGNPPTNSTTLASPAINALSPGVAGAHNTHYVNPNIGSDCSVCHNNRTIKMPSHTLDIGFNGYGGKFTSGTFWAYSSMTNTVAVSTGGGTIVRQTNNAATKNSCIVYCHGGGTNTLPPIGGGSNTNPKWEITDGSQVACGSCHGTSTTSAPTGGSHTWHATTNTGGLGLSCDTCHPHQDNNYHVSGNVKWHLNLSDSRIGANATYRGYSSGATGNLAPSATYSTCNNVYCHGNASPVWGTPAPMACNGCHSAQVNDATWAGRHSTHYASSTLPTSYKNISGNVSSVNTYRFTCSVCHNPAVTTHYGGGVSANQAAEVYFGYSGNRRGTYTAGGTLGGNDKGFSYTSGGTNCYTSYCHSNGRGGNPVNTSFNWTSPVGTLDCGGCHNKAGDASPVWSTPHTKHINIYGAVNTNFTCNDCHAATAANSSSIGNKANHVNKVVDVYFNGFASPNGVAAYPNTATGCSNTYCHSNGTDPNNPTHSAILWSGTKNCRSCHGGDSASSAPMATNKHRSHMNNYTTLGRGNNFKCAECHAKTVGFANNTTITNRANHVNKFKDYSGTKAGSYDTAQQICSNNYCHSSGQATPVFRSMTGSKIWSGSAKLSCNGCHGYGPGTFASFGAPNYASGAAGSPTANSHKKHVYDSGMTDTTGCVKCHRTTVDKIFANKLRDYSTAHLNQARDISFAKLANYSGHYVAGTKSCSNTYCHAGSSAQWGGASLVCTSCHNAGSSLPGRHNTHWATGDLPSKYLNYSGNVSQSGTYRFECNSCHNGGHANGPTTQAGANGDSAEIFFNFTTAGKGGKYNWSATTYTDGTLQWSNGRCSNTYCHSNGQATPGLANYTSIRWNSAVGTLTSISTGACTGCHGGNASTFKIMSSNRHRKHMNNAALIGTNFGCVECHAKTVSNDTTIGNKNNHVNKFRDFSGAKAYKSFYAGTSTNCANNAYCHTNGKTGVISQTATAVTWNQTAVWATKCNNCHGLSNSYGAPDYASGTAGTASANSHGKHAAASSDCVKCHRYTTSNGTSIAAAGTHLNGAINVNFSKLAFATLSGTYNSTVGQKNCSATYCHGSGTSPSWGTVGPLACDTCHKASNALPLAHTIHYDNATVFTTYTSTPGNRSSSTNYTFACASCHPRTMSNHAAGAVSATQAAQIFFGFSSAGRGGAIYTGGATSVQDAQGFYYTTNGTTTGAPAGTCNTSYCHSNGNGGNGNNTTYTWATAKGTIGCVGCHGNNAASTSPMATAKHADHINPATGALLGAGNGLGCVMCHAKTVSNDTTIGNKTNHVNKFKDFSSVRGGGSAKYSTATKTCSQIYCHSNGNTRNSSVTVFVSMTGSKIWATGGLTNIGCNGCHGRSNTYYGAPDYTSGGVGSTTPNSHATHITGLGITDTTGCAKCHAKTVNATTASKFKDYTAASYHLNGTRDVVFNSAGTYNSGAMSCSVTSCHGASTPVWGKSNPGYDTCTYCHGTLTATVTAANRYVVAPPNNTAGVSGTATGTGQVSNDPKVGAHQSHLRMETLSQFSNYSTVDFRCQNCHGPLPSSAPHANGNATPVFPSTGLATNHGSVTGVTFNTTNRTCSNTYCHNPAGTGGTLSSTLVGLAIQPSWTSAKYFPDATHKTQNNCNRCHLSPGDAGFSSTRFAHTGITIANDCSGCHGHNGDLSGTLGKRHMDGIRYGAGDCNSCHDFDTVGSTYLANTWTGGTWGVGKTAQDGLSPGEGWGAHAKHINYIKTRLGIATALDPTNQTFGQGLPRQICGTCHTNLVANHTTSGSTTGRAITFGEYTARFGGSTGTSFKFGSTNPNYTGVSGTTSATTAKTCQNISCHYFTTPNWSTY
ncbi:MAG TPA: CxxxxCH/CxxCH domain-containing protein [Geobacteraceae bacterium]